MRLQRGFNFFIMNAFAWELIVNYSISCNITYSIRTMHLRQQPLIKGCTSSISFNLINYENTEQLDSIKSISYPGFSAILNHIQCLRV